MAARLVTAPRNAVQLSVLHIGQPTPAQMRDLRDLVRRAERI